MSDIEASTLPPLPEIAWQYRYTAGILRMSWEAAGMYAVEPAMEVEKCPPADYIGVGRLRSGWPGINLTIVGPQEAVPAAHAIFEDPDPDVAVIAEPDVNSMGKASAERIDAIIKVPVTKQDDPDIQKEFLKVAFGDRWNDKKEAKFANGDGFSKVLSEYLCALAFDTAVISFRDVVEKRKVDLKPEQLELLSRKYAHIVAFGAYTVLCMPELEPEDLDQLSKLAEQRQKDKPS